MDGQIQKELHPSCFRVTPESRINVKAILKEPSHELHKQIETNSKLTSCQPFGTLNWFEIILELFVQVEDSVRLFNSGVLTLV